MTTLPPPKRNRTQHIVTLGLLLLLIASPAWAIDHTPGPDIVAGQAYQTDAGYAAEGANITRIYSLDSIVGYRLYLGNTTDPPYFHTDEEGEIRTPDNLQVDGDLVVGDALSVNGVAYTYPASQGTPRASLQNDGSGALTWKAERTFLGGVQEAEGFTSSETSYFGVVPGGYDMSGSSVDTVAGQTDAMPNGTYLESVSMFYRGSIGARATNPLAGAETVTATLHYAVLSGNTYVNGGQIATLGSITSSTAFPHATTVDITPTDISGKIVYVRYSASSLSSTRNIFLGATLTGYLQDY